MEEEEDEDEDKEEDEENIILVVMQGAHGHGRAALCHRGASGGPGPRVPVALGQLLAEKPRDHHRALQAAPHRGPLVLQSTQGSRTGAGQRGGDGPCGLWVTVRGTEQPPHTTSNHHGQISKGLWREAMPAPGAPQPCSRSLAPRASQPCNLPYQHLGAAAAVPASCCCLMEPS